MAVFGFTERNIHARLGCCFAGGPEDYLVSCFRQPVRTSWVLGGSRCRVRVLLRCACCFVEYVHMGRGETVRVPVSMHGEDTYALGERGGAALQLHKRMHHGRA